MEIHWTLIGVDEGCWEWVLNDLQEASSQSGIDMSMPVTQSSTWASLLTRTYGRYWARFRELFLIALTPALFAYLCTFMQRTLFRTIRAKGWLPELGSPAYFVVIMAIVLFEGAMYWLISGLFFAAVASSVVRESGSKEPVVADAFSNARRRLGAIVGVTLVIWAAFAVGRAVAGLALGAIIQRLGLLRNVTLVTIVVGVVFLLLAGLLSRLGLAIPILMDNPEVSARESLRRSLIKTENWEPFFMLFLAKAAVIGYAAYWIVNAGLNNLVERGMLRLEAFPWVQALFYICLAAMLEPPLFIAFSLLYSDSKAIPEDAVPAAVG